MRFQECDEDDATIEDGESSGDEQDDPGYVYKTDLLAFVKMLADACPEVGGLVNDNTGAMMSPEDIWKTARHILKMD